MMDTQSPPKVIILAGPTGSGKTGAALHIASSLEACGQKAFVINADSRQIYRDFPIITAQPSPEERQVCPHILYGYLATEEKSTAWEWAEQARQQVEKISSQGNIPILVGGTGMYLKTLTDGMANIPKPNPAISARLLADCAALGSQEMHRRLQEVDPETATRLHPNDRQRIVRALEVWESTGKSISWWHTHNEPGPNWNILRMGVGLPLAELTPFLELRIKQMLDMGAEEEARKAIEICPNTNAPGWSGIGCAEMGAWIQGRISFEECLKLWCHNTRSYAKRQWTWFRADSRLTWLRPEEKAPLERMVMEFLQ